MVWDAHVRTQTTLPALASVAPSSLTTNMVRLCVAILIVRRKARVALIHVPMIIDSVICRLLPGPGRHSAFEKEKGQGEVDEDLASVIAAGQ